MDSITVYEGRKLRGLHKTFTADVPDLTKECFNDCISSVKVVGQPWILYEHPNYQGRCIALEEGEHSHLPFSFLSSLTDKISSLKLITDDLINPQITVYENMHEGGKALVLTQESDMVFGGMNNKISSHRVQSGAWVLYENREKRGRCIVARAGEYLANYCDIGFNDQVSYVYPLRPGECTVTATILWDKKVESVRNLQIEQYSYTNSTDTEQQFTVTCTKEFEKYASHSFEFSNDTSLRAGVAFPLNGIVNIEGEVSNTFRVTKGETKSFTMKNKSELSTPVTVTPGTKAIVNFFCKEITISVPVELKIIRGGKTYTETGTYRCESSTAINTDVQYLPVVTQNDGAPL
uniref:Gep protein n=1 Tax=Cynops pyrrhogaster TaxID=8330 RepID=Q9PVY5_CYNPY|nr:gep [Cynops pyrrhogaster]